MLLLAQLDLDELARLLDERDYGAGYLDPETGAIHAGYDGEVFDEDGEVTEVEDHWYALSGGDSREAYRDMVAFTESMADGALRGALLRALEGRGAFRRFRDVLYNTPADLGPVWNRFADARSRLRALDWLESVDLVAVPEIETERARVANAADRILAEVGTGSGSRLVLLNGLPGVGKSAVARAYAAARSGTLALDVDVLRTMLGGAWADTAALGRARALDLAVAHLRDGHDVVVPQLVADDGELARFREAADDAGAEFVHVLLTGPTRPGTEPWQTGAETASLPDDAEALRRITDAAELPTTTLERTAAALGVLLDDRA